MSRPEGRALDGYARLYAALAVLTVVVSFQPLFARTVAAGGVLIPYPMLSPWQELADTAHASTVLGLALFLVLVALLTVGAFGGGSTGVAAGTAVVSVLLGILVLQRPGYSDPPPDLTPWGMVAVVVGFATAVLASTHAIHLWRLAASETS